MRWERTSEAATGARNSAPAVVHTHGQPGRAMTSFELWQFLLDVPDGEQPVVAELVEDGGGTRRFEVRGAYAADGIGEVVIELVERPA